MESGCSGLGFRVTDVRSSSMGPAAAFQCTQEEHVTGLYYSMHASHKSSPGAVSKLLSATVDLSAYTDTVCRYTQLWPSSVSPYNAPSYAGYVGTALQRETPTFSRGAHQEFRESDESQHSQT